MTRPELIRAVARKAGVKKGQAGRVLKALGKVLGILLQQRDKVSLSGMGTFKVKMRKEKVGRNPKTGEAVLIPANYKVSFKPSISLKLAVRAIPKVAA